MCLQKYAREKSTRNHRSLGEKIRLQGHERQNSAAIVFSSIEITKSALLANCKRKCLATDVLRWIQRGMKSGRVSASSSQSWATLPEFQSSYRGRKAVTPSAEHTAHALWSESTVSRDDGLAGEAKIARAIWSEARCIPR